MYRVFFYKKASGREVVSEFIESFSNEAVIKIRTDVRLLKEFGLSLMSTGKVKKISSTSDLYELRIKALVQIRLFFTLIKPDILLIVHGFIKKTNKIPLKELELAINRKKEFDK